MKARRMAKICTGQDGAIWGDYFFRFKSNGEGWVYELPRIMQGGGEAVEAFSTFCLDRTDLLMPHSNAVSFGCEYAEEGDEFPLLYTNIYNSYAKAEDKKRGSLLRLPSAAQRKPIPHTAGAGSSCGICRIAGAVALGNREGCAAVRQLCCGPGA